MFRRIILSFMLFVLSLSVSAITAQDSATQEADPTLDAMIQAYFALTATAEANPELIQTLDAQFHAVLTATAQSAQPTPTAIERLNTVTPTPSFSDNMMGVRTPLAYVPAGVLEMGTTPMEVRTAVDLCVNQHAGNCTLAMGEDSFPPHWVTLDEFYIEQTEVTLLQFVYFLNQLGPNSHIDGCGGFACAYTLSEAEYSSITFDGESYDNMTQNGQFPASGVTWYGANAYCEAIGRRLPTEAEWERAARGDGGRIYPWGNQWFDDYAKTNYPPTDPGPASVNAYMNNLSPYGVIGMAGNVAEWVSDWYAADFYSQPEAIEENPAGPIGGTDKVIRGGSWDAKPFFARSVHRQHLSPDRAGAWLGFRCATSNTEGEDLYLPAATATPSPTPTSED